MSIKNYISIVILLLIQMNLSAQNDTTYQTIRQENGEYNAPLIETPADRAFRTKVPSKWMFKLNLAQSFNFSNDSRNDFRNSANGVPLVIGAEYKISPALSVGAYYGLTLGYQPPSIFNENKTWLYSSSFAVESRWYHDMKKKDQKWKRCEQFGGEILCFGGQYI